MILEAKIVPKSKRNSITWYDKQNIIVKINIKAPPVDGKANKMIIAYLADFFEIKKNNIFIKSGLNAKFKRIEIELSEIELNKKLNSI